MPSILIDLVIFVAGVIVAYFFFWAERRQSNQSDREMAAKLTSAENATRDRFQLLEGRILSALHTFNLDPDKIHEIRALFDEAEFIEILEVIDPSGELKSDNRVLYKELTKRLLFFVIRKALVFPYPRYRIFIDWLNTQGYSISAEQRFSSANHYEDALHKIETLNRQGFSSTEIDSDESFSNDSPFRILR